MAIDRVRKRGAYAPLSATYFQDDDIAEAGEAAELLYVRGLAFCAGRASDGYMSETQVIRFVGVGMGDALDRAEQLVKVGLWEHADGGYVIRSWLKWNKSADEMGHYLSRDRDRKREAALDTATSDDAATPAESDSVDDAESAFHGDVSDSARNPDGIGGNPHPSAVQFSAVQFTQELASQASPESASETGETLFDATDQVVKKVRRKPGASDDPNFVRFYAIYPRPVAIGKAEAAWMKAIKIAKPEEIIDGAERFRDSPAGQDEARFIPYPATWLNAKQWKDAPVRKPPQAQSGRRDWGKN